MSDLDVLNQIAEQVHRSATYASLAHLAAEGSTDPDIQKAAQAASLAHSASENALTGLRTLGAAVHAPGANAALNTRSTVPLHLLNTDAARALLVALEAAANAGFAVDQERGWTNGFGETYKAQADLLRWEIEGPKGRE